MAYNNDVSTIEIFEKVYLMSGVDWLMEYNVCEIAYAIGLFSGIAVFYDHFAGKKMSKALNQISMINNILISILLPPDNCFLRILAYTLQSQS